MISAEVIADSSAASNGRRVTTMVVTMHRFVLAEFNTHRVFSRNSASSRAIPLARQIARINDDLAVPVVWASEKAGMQGGAEISNPERALYLWRKASYDAITWAEELAHLGVHKSICNRLIEPFMYHTVVVTSTEWDNFFGLRCHPAAQPEIRAAAELMREAYDASEPRELAVGEWHAPFWSPHDGHYVNDGIDTSPSLMEIALKTSAARCAWVSTLKYGQEATWEDVERIYSTLTSGLDTSDPIHASPFEHQCTPLDRSSSEEWYGDSQGNLRGWKQLRHMIEDGKPPWR